MPLGVLISGLFVFFFPHVVPTHSEHKIDFAGFAALILFVVPTMLALSWGGAEYPWGSAQIIGMLAFSAVMLITFLILESRAQEPVIPLSLFRNRIVNIAMLVIFITGFGMFGGIIFIPLFFQGVLGMEATNSGVFLIPMMLGVVVGSLVSGQILSRTGGHYRLQGVVGLAVMAGGMALLSRWTMDTSYPTACFNIVLLGLGLGSTMPLYVIAVQNAVPYAVMGAATSQTIFFRQMGGAFGLAIFNSVMNDRYASEVVAGLSPSAGQPAIPPELIDGLADSPRVLMNEESYNQLVTKFQELFGAGWQSPLETTVTTLKESLATSIAHVFLIGLGFILLGWLTNFFIKEIPLRKQHV